MVDCLDAATLTPAAKSRMHPFNGNLPAGAGAAGLAASSPEPEDAAVGTRLQRLDSMDRRIRVATGPTTLVQRRAAAAHRRTPSVELRLAAAAERFAVEFSAPGPLGLEFAWPFVAAVRPDSAAQRAGLHFGLRVVRGLGIESGLPRPFFARRR